jgi:hypothetical protein
LLSACMAVSTFAMNPIPVAAATKTVTVCIDPGHGGSNMGAQYKNRMKRILHYRLLWLCTRSFPNTKV